MQAVPATVSWIARASASLGVAGLALVIAAHSSLAATGGATFHAPEELAIFAPEVARVVVAALERAGLDAASVSGRIERIDAEKVRVRAQATARNGATPTGAAPVAVVVEGHLENIDVLAGELSRRLIEQMQGGSRRLELADTRGARAALPATAAMKNRAAADSGGATADSPLTHAQPAAPSPLPSLPSPLEAPHPKASDDRGLEITPTVQAATEDSRASARAPVAGSVDKPAPIETSTAAVPAPRRRSPTPPAAPEPAPAEATAPAVEDSPPSVSASDSEPPPAEPSTGNRLTRRPRFAFRWSGRALLHTVATPSGCNQGVWATLGARQVLEQRIPIASAPAGCGIVSPAAATTEALQGGASAVVMLAFDRLRFESVPTGLRPAGHLRVVVVRDGQVVLSRGLEVLSHPLLEPDYSRAAYDLTVEGLGKILDEVQAAATPEQAAIDPR